MEKQMSRKLRAYGITDKNVTVNFDDGQTHIMPRTDPLADKLIQALREGRQDEIPEMVSKAKRIEKYGQGNFKVQDGRIHINGIPVPQVLSAKIIKFQEEGLPHEPLVKFAENLQKNPSFRAVNELFQFLEKNDHPITDNGCFIAYKKVREDFLDVHSGTFDNSPGNVVEMSRNQVNEDSTQTCSAGLHVANFDYASNFYSGGNMLEVEVNPADVVSIPVDYNQAKMRVCKYLVLGVVDKVHSSDEHLRVTTPASPCCHHDDCCEEEEEEDDFEEEEEDEEDEEDSEEDETEEDEEDEEDEDEDDYPWDDELDT
jgi:hypothetical protein